MIRTDLLESEYTYPPKQGRQIICFFGKLKGIRLVTRGKNDNHICFEILTEDDNNWFVSEGNSSSHWLLDLQEVMFAAIAWLETNAEKDTSEFGTYGYRLKS